MPIQFSASANPPANYITIPRASQLDCSIVTVMIWMCLRTSPGSDWEYLVSYGDSYILVYNYGGTGFNYFFFRNGGSYFSINDATAISVGEWVHIAGVYSPGVSWLMYRNGVQSATGSSSTAMTFDALRPLGIGAGGVGTEGRNLLGDFSDVRIYNRVVTANEMLTIASCSGRDGITSGLVGRWMLGEGSEGLTVPTTSGYVKDISDYKNNGTMVINSGAPVYTSGFQSYRRGQIYS